MRKTRLHSLRRVNPDYEPDSIKRSKLFGERRAFDVLMDAQRCWDNMDRFRHDRERAKRYTYGDQWGDIIEVDGQTMTEEEYIKSRGQVPLTNNLIRRLVKNVVGVYRNQGTEPMCVARDREEQPIAEALSTLLQYNMQVNQVEDVCARALEDFLIGGVVAYRVWYGWRNSKLDCWADAVAPNNFFVDGNMRDYRGWDVSCIGEVHDISFQALCSNFAESEADYRKLRDIYAHAHDRRSIQSTCEQFGYSRLHNYDFLFTDDPTRCRVIEVWRKESKPRYRCHDLNTGEVFKIEVEDYDEFVTEENAQRLELGLAGGMAEDDIPLVKAEWFIDDYWYFYYLTPFGHILKEGETPYEHKEHPYVFVAYPFVDGEIHSFVSDVIDQQRYANRLITMYDWIMRSSAKGVMMFPEDALPESMSMDDIADEWSRVGGVILYKPKPGVPAPQQISGNATNVGISELLNLQLRFFEEISGVQGALQGKVGYSGTSAALYRQQVQNATTSLVDILDVFAMLRRTLANKIVKDIQQYYDDRRILSIVGKIANKTAQQIGEMHNVDFDISIAESAQTPAYRQVANEFLLEIWKSQQISLEQLLEYGDFPFADALLQNIKSQKEQAKQGDEEAAQNLSPEMMQQMQAQQMQAQQMQAQQMQAQQMPQPQQPQVPLQQ